MAFCTSCGSMMDDNAHFCTKCGKTVSPLVASSGPSAAAKPAPIAAAPVPAQPQSSGVLKIILIVVAVLVLLGILVVAGIVYGAYHMRKNMRISQHGNSTTIETPFGKVSGGAVDSSEAMSKIGVDIYPGASQVGQASAATLGNLSTVNVVLTTGDSVEQVADFYRKRFPKTVVTSSNEDRFSLVARDADSTITIAAERNAGGTRIAISKMTNAAKGSGDSE